MDYKQKYEQALERAKVINPGTADYEVVVKIFPELKESEDEKVRRKLINALNALKECSFTHFSDELTVQEALAWLEKQGEQKPAWSEEDELNLNQAIYVCHQYQYVGVETWLKSLKERMKGE